MFLVEDSNSMDIYYLYMLWSLQNLDQEEFFSCNVFQDSNDPAVIRSNNWTESLTIPAFPVSL